MKRKAIFPGTFDPFTMGHASLVERSLKIVDEVVIAIGINDTKKHFFSIDNRLDMIRSLYQDDERISICTYDCLTVDFAEEINANLIVRGIRSINDFEYEKSIADINRHISGIETVILLTEPEFTHISSTIVRELMRYEHDVTAFLPKGLDIKKYMD